MNLFDEIWYDDSYGKLPRSYRRDNIDALLYYIKGANKSPSANKETAERRYYMHYDIRRFIKKVKFNPPATIVFWTDNTKTVVYEVFKKWLPKEDDSDVVQKVLEHIKPKTFEFELKPIDINQRLFEVLTGANGKTTIEFKDTKEEPKHNPIEEAYKKLVEHRNGNGEIDLDELIGLLGEALDS